MDLDTDLCPSQNSIEIYHCSKCKHKAIKPIEAKMSQILKGLGYGNDSSYIISKA